MITREEQARMENKVKDYIIDIGSPVNPQAIAHKLNIPWHTAKNILNRFEDNKLVTPLNLGKITFYQPTEKLTYTDFKKFKYENGKLVEIKEEEK